MTLAQWMDLMLSDQNPLLPSAATMRLYLRTSWVLVLLLCVTWLMRLVALRRGRSFSGFARMAPTGLALGCMLLQGDLSPAYGLGLAFNMPSVLGVLLCIGVVQKHVLNRRDESEAAPRGTLIFVALGVALGYALLLDTLALLPVQLYAWGFSPAALACALLVSVIPCIALNPLQRGNAWTCLMPLALIVFVTTRLPTGNVWDVLLDPLLWLVLQIYLLIKVRARMRQR
jgi:hypothetical protein